ncbi:speriolin-like protein isoform X2 [Rhinoderma darwinii]|uniref:speriolin-like protein isoform X2 n=1 Tax=Rhinoderma darwinii TaxID=43563 RepID=UPI003F675865
MSSGNSTMDQTLDILKIEDADTLSAESKRLLTENAKLRKLMGLMQENMELRGTLREHERKIRGLSPPGKSKKDLKDKDKKQLEVNSHPNTKDEAQPTDSYPQLDPEKVKQCQRIVGEIAFQLDRRILCAVFLERQRLYGYHVANIKEKITQVTTCSLTGKVDDQLKSELSRRYHQTIDQLKKLGYDPKVHPYFTEYLVNAYGIIKERANTGIEDLSSMNDPQILSKMITEYMLNDKTEDILIILNCLAYLTKQNGKTMFMW